MLLSIIEPSQQGTYELYLKSIHRFETLTQEQVRNLIDLFIATGDEKYRNQVVNAHLLYVVSIANGFYSKGKEIMELIALGNQGLVEAVPHYDTSSDTDFASYATCWIRKYILNFLKTPAHGITRTRATKEGIDYDASYEAGEPVYMLVPSIEVDSLSNYRRGDDENDIYGDENSEALTLSDILGHEAEADHYYEEQAMRRAIMKGLDTLPMRDALVVRMSFGIECDKKDDEVIADKLHLKKNSVRRIREAALRQLQGRIKRDYMD